ncbi:MAG: glycosyl hydrolase, partial [Pirellulaceae bacterium]|nr:glycosyl hydrolase [Pirellulaceae bacterium]
MTNLTRTAAILLSLWFSLVDHPAGAQLIDESPSMAANTAELLVARQRIADALAKDSIVSPSRVVVVYFTPRDRQPAANHTARIRRIVSETSGFYESELQRHGFDGRRMNVLRNDADQVEIITVVGRDEDKDYDKPDGQRIRQEVVAVLRQRNIDPERSVLLLFCNLMDYDPVESKISHHSPYYGGGSYLAGTAWQCDSEILDPKRLTDSTPILDGQYGRITIGKHNSIFIGGVIHELGHALSLPHCRERNDEAVRGTALMGSGNRTYAQQLRGEGKGTFLTQAHAMRLAAHPTFLQRTCGDLYERPGIEWPSLRIDSVTDGRIRVRATVRAAVPVHSVVAYFDPEGGSDYDATTATAVPDDVGAMELVSGRLQSGRSGQLRLVTCHVNGAVSQREFNYRVGPNGQADLSSIRLALELSPMMEALRKSGLEVAADELKRLSEGDSELRAIGQNVLDRFVVAEQAAAVTVDSIAANQSTIALSRLKPESAEVGWIRPTYNAVPSSDRLLSIDGDFFAEGIYAHAPAKHVYRIDGQWKTFTGRCGLQSGHRGKVDFEIIGDDKTLWKADGISMGPGKSFDVDVTGIDVLTLKVSDGGDGTAADWGVWIEPT